MRLQAMLTFAVLTVAGCGSIELEPQPPPLVEAHSLGPDAAELIVVVPAGQAGYKWSWAVLVDGEARAWLPNAAGYTRIPVAPGRHDVTVSFRTLWVGYFLIVPIPDGSEVNATATAHCQPRACCGVVVERHYDPVRRLTLSASEARPELLAELIHGLTERSPVP